MKLLQHFIDPYTGQTLPTSKTNICQKQFRLFDIEVERAKDHGLIQPGRKARGPEGLRAESARAVTGRRCPHSGEGEDFLTVQKLDCWPKTSKFGPKLAFLAKYGHFWPI